MWDRLSLLDLGAWTHPDTGYIALSFPRHINLSRTEVSRKITVVWWALDSLLSLNTQPTNQNPKVMQKTKTKTKHAKKILCGVLGSEENGHSDAVFRD